MTKQHQIRDEQKSGTQELADKQNSKPKATKSELIIKALNRKNGASLDELMKLTGWQAHSVRGFLSGTVNRKLGLAVERRTNAAGNSRYVILPEKG